MKNRSGIEKFWFWNLDTKSSEGVYGEGQMPPTRGGGERNAFIVEISRNTEVRRGAPE